MKSNLFLKNDLKGNEAFARDFFHLFNLPDDIIEKIPNYAMDIIRATTSVEMDRVYDEAAQKLGERRLNVRSAINITVFFIKQFVSKGDAATDLPNDIVDDISTEFQIEIEKVVKLIRYFENIKDLATNNQDSFIFNWLKTKNVLPSTTSVETYVQFRVVFKEDYEQEENIGNSVPLCLGSIPVGIVKLNLEGGATKEFLFEVNEEILNTIISHLGILRNKMLVAKDKLSIKDK